MMDVTRKDRRWGIGGTDISAIVGLNPFKTPLDVWLEKTGNAEPQEDNENMWWGREMEPVLAKRYEKETGTALLIPHAEELPGTHPKYPWYIGSPDALKYEHGMIRYLPKPTLIKAEGGIDFKTSGKPDEWGEPGTDEVPQHYLIQAEWYMGLTGAQWWDIAVLLMGFTRKFAIYRIHRDDELIEGLTEAGAKFWQDHVLANVPPPLDGSKSATEYLKRKYPLDTGPMLETTDELILDLIEDYHGTRKVLKQIGEHADYLENHLKAIIGDCAGMQGPWGRITWHKAKDATTTDWKASYMALCDYAHDKGFLINDEDFSGKFTTVRPGPRRWLPKFKGE